MHQHRLARLHVAEVHQRVVRRQEHDGNGGGLRERPALGYAGEQPAVGHRQGPEGAEEHAHHPVTRLQVLYSGTDLDHHPGALAADPVCPGTCRAR